MKFHEKHSFLWELLSSPGELLSAIIKIIFILAIIGFVIAGIVGLLVFGLRQLF